MKTTDNQYSFLFIQFNLSNITIETNQEYDDSLKKKIKAKLPVRGTEH